MHRQSKTEPNVTNALSKSRDKWMDFFKSNLIDPSSTEINLRNKRLGLMNLADLRALLEVIIESPATSLDIGENPFFLTFDDEKLTLLLDKILHSQITQLKLDNTGLVSAGAGFAKLEKYLPESKLDLLDISKNNLQNLTVQEIHELFTGIKDSHIKTLDISGNNLKFLAPEKLAEIINLLNGSQVTQLITTDCKLDSRNQALLEASLEKKSHARR
jgi:hypothetical protein